MTVDDVSTFDSWRLLPVKIPLSLLLIQHESQILFTPTQSFSDKVNWILKTSNDLLIKICAEKCMQ